MDSSSRSGRRATAASEETNNSANARKKPRIWIPLVSDSEYETVERRLGHEKDDGGEEEEKESQGESDGDGVVEPAPSARAAVVGVTVQDADALECGVCCLPLRPPIFQCEVGHVVCSPCRDKLAPAGKCHVCAVAIADYRRCHAMENFVDSIRVACPHAAHGCSSRLAYHGLDAHRQTCPHSPCHCPGEGCGFVASTAALLDHFASAHNWPCTTNVRAGETVSVQLHDGFTFLRVYNHRRGRATFSDHLIMLNMTLEPLGRVISVLCIHPHAAEQAAMQCKLLFVSRYGYDGDGGMCRSHYQKSEFHVGYSDLADGLPDPKNCFQFVVPWCVVGDDDESGIQIKARIINSLVPVF